MKKILFMLLAATTLFSSCSSDDDTINNGGNNTPDTKKYTVNLNVKSAGFEVDKTPLRNFTGEESYPYYNFQVVVYKQTGEVYSDSVMLYEEFNPLVNKDGTLPFTLNLPQGNYHIALLHNPYSSSPSQPAKKRNVINPISFYTDTYSSFSYGNTPFRQNNANIYYKTFDLQVSDTSDNEVKSISLDPMWSEVTLTIKDPKTFTTPNNKGNLLLKIEVLPVLYGLKVENGMAIFNQDLIDTNLRRMEAEVRKSDSLNYTFYVSRTSLNDTLAMRVDFLSYPSKDSIILSKTIKFNQVLENGNRYKISGNLGNIAGVEDNNQSFNISLGSFAKDDVNIEF